MVLGRAIACHPGPLGSVREASNGFVLPKDRTRRDTGREDAYCCVIFVPSLVGTVQFKIT